LDQGAADAAHGPTDSLPALRRWGAVLGRGQPAPPGQSLDTE